MHDLLLRTLAPADAAALAAYLDALSAETRRRFAPHPFDRATVEALAAAAGADGVERLIAVEPGGAVVGYALVRRGHLAHEVERLRRYGVPLAEAEDAFFAPSVADRLQGAGLGSALLRRAVEGLRAEGRRRLFLWGGVQKDNARAVAYYRRHGFAVLGEWEWQGANLDMVLAL